LVLLSGLLLIIFGGITDRLIPLFAVGAFLAFTLSQAGMVMHWRRSRGRHAHLSTFINGIGATATGIALCIILLAKFTEGAWITVLLIPALIGVMCGVRRHYESILGETAESRPAVLQGIEAPIVVLPMERWSRVAEKGLRFAYSVARDIRVVHIVTEENEKAGRFDLRTIWSDYIEKPAQRAGLNAPELVILHSPYRIVVTPIYEYVLEVERKNPDRYVAVLVPELVEKRWLYYLLHRQRSTALRLMLYRKGDRRIVVVDIPWYVAA
jgi:hypothetical protein